MAPTSVKQASRKLKDGTVLTMSLGDMSEETVPMEMLFSQCPGIGGMGIAGLVIEAISECCGDLREEMMKNIVVCGGNSQHVGMAERIESELKSKSPNSPWKVIASGTAHSSWVGAKRLAASLHETGWITFEQYSEYGPCIFHRTSIGDI